MKCRLTCCFLFVLLMPAAQATAETGRLPETLRFFNDCAGRVAAHISVHGWNDRMTVTRDHLASIDAIVESFAAGDDARLASRQSAARAAHVALLQHAMEHGDLVALARARAQIERCREAVIAP
jgi:hypothetical protein